MRMKWVALVWALFAVVCLLCQEAVPASSHPLQTRGHDTALTLVSSQFNPIDETETFRGILSRAPVPTNFLPLDSTIIASELQSQEQSHHVTTNAILGLHGDFPPMVSAGYLQDVTPLLNRLKSRGFPSSFLKLSRMGSKKKHYYVPLMQATYVLAVNKKALKYLPKGANVNALTYNQWIQWGKNMKRGTGRPMIGLPAGATGLIHRFIQGYLYPSFTHSSGVRAFRSAAAIAMWQKMKQLWAVTNPQSTNYSFMQEPLLSGEVWVAWDHVARLIDAATKAPNQFILVPAPSGPTGRGYMVVIVGIAIPKGAPNVGATDKLIDFLTKPAQQLAIAEQLAFFPATNAKIPRSFPPGIRLEALAVQRQAQSKHTTPALLPIGLGTRGGDFNKVFLDTFDRIVLNNEGIKAVLNDEAPILRQIMRTTGAPCWPPDKPSKGPCPVS